MAKKEQIELVDGEGKTVESIVIDDIRRARQAKKDLLEAMKEDFEFAAGKQWDDTDKETLEKAGVRALTINKIQPNLFLISGIERQNRTDFKAFPEGEEDSPKSEIATSLLKNVMKQAAGEYKLSEIFEDGCICGEGWIEPYIDYTYDLLNGAMKFKKVSAGNVLVDPDSTEYDLSDAEYVAKLTPNLTKKQVLKVFPDKEKEIKSIGAGKLNLDLAGGETDQTGLEVQKHGYNDNAQGDYSKEAEYDLTEYYYKRYEPKWVVADKKQGTLREALNEQEAKTYCEQANASDPAGQEATAVYFKRIVPEIWVKSLIGNSLIDDRQCLFYPRWKGFPLIPFFAHRLTTPLKDREYMTQGIVRGLKDPQRELNKRRTQELRILNTSANSGWICEQGAWVKKNEVKKYGASPGVILEYKKGFTRPERITPTPLSQGHAQLAAENAQDIKEISGINADLLALQEGGTDSGRAIALRQKQGLVMLQRILDNYGQTKRLLGKFVLSQLGELYTVETATKVLGDAFIKEQFSKPVMLEPGRPQIDETTGEMAMELDNEAVGAMFNLILNDAELIKYDISVGESANTETVRYANSLLLMDLASKGIPIPPDVLIDESTLAEGTKKKINQAIARQAAAGGAPPRK